MESEKGPTDEGIEVPLLGTESGNEGEKDTAKNSMDLESVECVGADRPDSSPKEDFTEEEKTDIEEVPQHDNSYSQNKEDIGKELSQTEVSNTEENINSVSQKPIEGEKGDTGNLSQPPQDDVDDVLSNINNFINNISSESGDKKNNDTETTKEETRDVNKATEHVSETGLSESIVETLSDKTEQEKQQIESPEPEIDINKEPDEKEIQKTSLEVKNRGTPFGVPEPEEKEIEVKALEPGKKEKLVELSPSGKEETNMDDHVSEPESQLDITEPEEVEEKVDSLQHQKKDGQVEISESEKNEANSADNLQLEKDVVPSEKDETNMDVSEPESQLDITEPEKVEEKVDSLQHQKKDGQVELSESEKNEANSADKMQLEKDVVPSGKEEINMDVSDSESKLDTTEPEMVDSLQHQKKDGQVELSESEKNEANSADHLQLKKGEAKETDVNISERANLENEKESENQAANDTDNTGSNIHLEDNLDSMNEDTILATDEKNEADKEVSQTAKQSEQDMENTFDKEKQRNEESKINSEEKEGGDLNSEEKEGGDLNSEEKEGGDLNSDSVKDSTTIDQNRETTITEPMEVDVALDESKENSFEVEKASSVSPKAKADEHKSTKDQNDGDDPDIQITRVAGSLTKKGDTIITIDESDEKADQKKPIHLGEDKKPKIMKTEIKEDEKSTSKDTKSVSKVQECVVCKKVSKCKFNIVRNGDIKHLCDDACFKVFRANPSTYLRSDSQEKGAAFTKNPATPDLCYNCGVKVFKEKLVLVSNNGELQFCSNRCVTAHKKKMKLCACCQRDVSSDANAFMAPVSGGTEFKDFCSQLCLQKYEEMGIARKDTDLSQVSGLKHQSICAVCKLRKSIKHEVTINTKVHTLCSDSCFTTFRYANKLSISNCEQCSANLQKPGVTVQTIQHEGVTKKMCSVKCVLVYKSLKTRLVPCAWCRAKKSNFDMVERVDENNKCQLFCSLNCLSLFRVNLQATSNTNVPCDFCHKASPAQYHLTMSDASVRNFCSYNCVIAFQSQFSQPTSKGNTQPIKTGEIQSSAAQKALTNTRTSSRQRAKAAKKQTETVQGLPQIGTQTGNLQISNVMSLAPQSTSPLSSKLTVPSNHRTSSSSSSTSSQVAIATPPPPPPPPKTQVIIQPQAPKQVRNKSLMCKPFTQTKSTLCRPLTQTIGCQTDESLSKQVLIPVPVPIYVPVPMRMYSTPVPYPVPIPVPIPIPMFIPTTKKNADSILKHIKEIQERMPADPFEAEMLMMAEMVATEDKDTDSDSTDDDNDTTPAIKPDVTNFTSPAQENVLAANDMGEDMLQMALRMAQEMPNEPILDVEESLQGSTINPDAPSGEFSTIDRSADIFAPEPTPPPTTRRGRGGKRRGGGRGAATRSKRQKIEEPPPAPSPAPVPAVLQNAPDAGMVLKYTYGVNAWKHWVAGKNAHIEKTTTTNRNKIKFFKTDILACTADELNFSLCLFVKEVRKPNGEEYAPDSIYYLCLGIQQYLFENGRIDNIFTDIYCERFTECLNEVLSKYEVRLNAQGLIVCRIEEEHLWESKQLGAHSPHVLLNTLVYFNTKFFMLRSGEDHLKLSFSHIMKQWKKTNTATGKTPGRSVYLRYYAPTGQGPDAAKKKREDLPVFEQGENVDNPLRCPVKLYEFYLSKCPESIKNRNDVFYLIPERSCVPDSPVWYSTANLGMEPMMKMLNRLRLVREIQESMLHQNPYYCQ